MIGEHLGIDPMSFIVGRKFDSELKELDKKLCRCYIGDRRLCLRQGKPLTVGQYRVALWYDTEEEGEERFTPLRNQFVVHKAWSLQDFHENFLRVEEEEDGDVSMVPPLELLRLRKKFREHMTEFVYHEGTLNSLQGLHDGFQIVIQRLKQPGKLTKTDLILRLIRYRPKSRSYDHQEHEVILSRKTPINQFGKEAIVPIIGDEIPLEHLQWAKAAAFPKALDYMKWKSSSDDDTRTLHKAFFKNGLVVLYRDGRDVSPDDDEEEDVRAAEVGAQGGSERHWRAGGGAVASRYRPKERGIKIFTAQEQVERDKNKEKRVKKT